MNSLDYYYWYKEHGICVKCKNEMADKETMCLQCRMDERACKKKRYPEKEKIYQANLRAYRIENHICVHCGKPLPSWDNRKACGICRAKENAHKREVSHKNGVIPMDLAGKGIYCAVCLKPVEIKGEKLCKRCYTNCINNLNKATPEGRERSKARFIELNTVFWNEVNEKRAKREADKIQKACS